MSTVFQYSEPIERVQKQLDSARKRAHYLTMVKNAAPAAAREESPTATAALPATQKGEQTRQLIFATALELFREKGFDATTMQDVAARAGVVKSAAYYYFPGKEAIIQSYYEVLQAEQERICDDAFARGGKLRARLGIAMETKFDLVRHDRKLLGVVFRYTGEPEHPLSCLGQGTAEIRRRAVDIFRQAIAEERLPRDLEELLPIALWSLQMGLLVMFLYDGSEDQKRTRSLADGALDLTLRVLSLARLPLLKPVRTRVLQLLKDAELV